MKAAAGVVWVGAEALRPFLVAVETLEPFPENPNQGDVESVRESFARFGQLVPIVVDGSRIVAGHTRVAVAEEMGWTHVAAVPNDFGSEEEQRAFLLADNRTAELAVRDPDMLAAQLAQIRDNYVGTGYTEEDRVELERRLALLRNPVFPAAEEDPPALDARSTAGGLFEVPLLLGPDDRKDFARLVGMLRREWGLDATTDVVLRAVREAAMRT